MDIKAIKKQSNTETKKRFNFNVIRKKSGGWRPITALKAVCKPYFEPIMAKINLLPIHENAMAYESKKSIKTTLEKHKNDLYFYKFDFTDFFGSFDLYNILKIQNNMFNENELGTIVLRKFIVTDSGDKVYKKQLALAQGSPVSPKLTNYWMYKFDEKMTIWAKANNLTYSRYADDILISGQDNLPLKYVQDILIENLKRSKLGFLKLNKKKTAKLKRGGKIRFLGTSISADKRVTIGHKERKQVIGQLRMFQRHKVVDKGTAYKFAQAINKAIYINAISDNKIDVDYFLTKTSMSRVYLTNAIASLMFDTTYTKLSNGKKLAVLNNKNLKRGEIW